MCRDSREQDFSQSKAPYGKFQISVGSEIMVLFADDWFSQLAYFDGFHSETKSCRKKLPMSPEEEDRFIDAIRNALKRGAPDVTLETVFQKKDGTAIRVLIRGVFQDSPQGKLLDAVLVELPEHCDLPLLNEKNMGGQDWIQEEQRRLAKAAESLFLYEVNITKDLLLRGDTTHLSELGLVVPCSYTDFLLRSADKMIYPEDRKEFLRCLERESILFSFQNGKHEIAHEYRKKTPGGMIWVRTTLHMIQEPEKEDICVFFDSKDIDEQKKKELELKRKAEMDPLSGLYNRSTAQSLINTFLSKGSDNKMVSALFMLDVDNFKQINDTFGHLFGDAVLSEIAHKLRMTFRSDDVISRIGGDEFVVFLKDAPEEGYIYRKAGALCESLLLSYSSSEQEYQISGSVGVALAPKHGMRFEELYDKADMALYEAKSRGKNQYAVYEDGRSAKSKNAIIHNSIEQGFEKSFADSASEYIFKILYHSNNVELAISSVLELLAKHYKADRGYVMEYSEKQKKFIMTHEWHDKKRLTGEGFSEPIEENAFQYYENFDASGLYCVEDLAVSEAGIQQIPANTGAKSMIQGVIASGSEYKGFIGIEDYRINRLFTRREREIFLTAAEIIGTFILNAHNAQARENYTFTLKAILDNLDSYLYVVHPETHELVFINKKTYEVFPHIRAGELCYHAIRQLDAPCEDCPIAKLTQGFLQKSSAEILNGLLNRWFETSASWIKWLDGEQYCLINSVDITKFKQENGGISD